MGSPLGEPECENHDAWCEGNSVYACGFFGGEEITDCAEYFATCVEITSETADAECVFLDEACTLEGEPACIGDTIAVCHDIGDGLYFSPQTDCRVFDYVCRTAVTGTYQDCEPE